jgi:hypothetical protein
MKTKILTIVATILLIFSCRETESNKLKLNKTFNASQTDQIIEMLGRFDKEICNLEGKQIDDLLACYQSFFLRMQKGIENGKFDIGISDDNQKMIMEALDEDLRKEFWVDGVSTLNRTLKNASPNHYFLDTIQTILITNGKFLEFLKSDVASISVKAKEYYDRYIEMGTMTPSLEADVITNYSDYDVTDERVRLLIAVHYLTKNFNNNRRDSSYNELYKEIGKELESRQIDPKIKSDSL